MSIPLHDLLLAELDREMGVTRRVLERIPQASLEWRPHPRSRSLGELGTHLADLPGWAAVIATTVEFDLGDQPAAAVAEPSVAALLARHDTNVARVRASLLAQSDAELAMPWRLTRDGRPVLTVPRAVAIRAQLFGHVAHHRGQLTVYLRLLDVPLPPVYGPTADEGTV